MCMLNNQRVLQKAIRKAPVIRGLVFRKNRCNLCWMFQRFKEFSCGNMSNIYIQCAPPVMFVGLLAPVTIVKSTINHSSWTYAHQLSYRTGASHCIKCWNIYVGMLESSHILKLSSVNLLRVSNRMARPQKPNEPSTPRKGGRETRWHHGHST